MASHPSIHIEIARQRHKKHGMSQRRATRELAQRRSGTEEVLLLWHPDSDRVELSVRDVATGAGFRIDVAPGSAIDAFYHPYMYVPARETLMRGVSQDEARRGRTTTVDD
jgi:hypothetical protein